jgi:hypothetical protein
VSVDISQLTAKLDPQRQETIREQYEERATNPTAAFLLCFFLGSAGAHRFYLGEWRVALAHLALFVAGVAALVAGLTQTLPLTEKLATHPVGALLDALGVVLLLVALIWEIIDLGRIDHQVYQRNLLLAEGIIAGNLLADHTVEDRALQRAEADAARAHAQAQAAGIAAPLAGASAAGAGIITADEVADARKLAEEHAGSATISYSEMSRFDVSADPDQARQARADAAHTGDWTTTNTTADTLPGASPDAAPIPMAETVTRTHTEEGSRVTDGYEVDRVSGPSALEVAGLGAADLGAAALGAGLYGAAHEATHESAPEAGPEATSAYEPYEPAGFDEPTQPAYPASAPEPPHFADATDGPAVAAPAYAYDFGDDLGDITDANMPAVAPPASDVAMTNASPAYVQLPDERQASGWEPAAPFSALPEEEPSTAVYHAPPPPLPGEPDYFAPHSAEAPAESYVPPVASVYSSPAEAPVAPTPSWDQPTSPQPEPQPAHDEHLGELAGLAGLAGAGALAGEALAHSHHEPEPTPEPVAAAPEPPKMKRIRVRRKVVVDGEVVAEEVVEREIPADMDTKTAAEQIQAELGHLTPEQIAQRAHLSPDEEVELRQRTEGM